MVMKALFGSKKEEKPATPALDMNNKEQLKELEKDYKKKLQREMRELERGVLHNDLTTKKAENELKKALKETKDRSIHSIYAKQVAQCRKQKGRLLNNKAKIQGMIFSIESMFANMRMTKILGDTSGLVKQINGLMNIKEISSTMKDIQKSMMQVINEEFGLMNEMVDDAMATLDEDADDMEDTDLDKIIDSVQNPEKYKDKNYAPSGEMQENNDLDDFEAKLKQLS